MKIELNCEECTVNYARVGKISATLSDVDIADIIDQVGQKALLDAIGRQECIDHYGIEEAE